MTVFFLSEQLAFSSKIVAKNICRVPFWGCRNFVQKQKGTPTQLGCSHLFRKQKQYTTLKPQRTANPSKAAVFSARRSLGLRDDHCTKPVLHSQHRPRTHGAPRIHSFAEPSQSKPFPIPSVLTAKKRTGQKRAMRLPFALLIVFFWIRASSSSSSFYPVQYYTDLSFLEQKIKRFFARYKT